MPTRYEIAIKREIAQLKEELAYWEQKKAELVVHKVDRSDMVFGPGRYLEEMEEIDQIIADLKWRLDSLV